MTRHLAKLFDAIWYLSMGLFLGLTAGIVLSVIMTFKGARAIDAEPGTAPFNDPRFAEYHNEAVAGYIGQDLFAVGLKFAGICLLTAIAIRIAFSTTRLLGRTLDTGSTSASKFRNLALFICLFAFSFSQDTAMTMNADWPGLYDLAASQEELTQRREAFEQSHQESERITTIAWFCGLIALGISPWCQRVADTKK